MQNLALDLAPLNVTPLDSVQAPALQPAPPPPDHYIVEVEGRFVSEYGTLTAALSAGLELKRRDARAQVKVYDARERVAG